ncbi:MAG: hypothetical protein SOI24_09990 [Coriobacteriales bacterium]
MSAALEPMITDDPYQFDTDQHNVPLFTRKNMDLIHALLRYDSAYSAAFDTEDDDSYAGWLHRHGVPTKFDDVERIINQIDAANSTHLASQGRTKGGKGRELTAGVICGIKNLKERLSEGDDSLVDEIAKGGGKNKYNFSFASKFCAYVCLFARDIGQDKYCIYDNVVSQVLPYYAYLYADEKTVQKYSHPKRGKVSTVVDRLTRQQHDYTSYRKLVDAVIAGINQQGMGPSITYADFDQLVWYYFKRDGKLISDALRYVGKVSSDGN